MSIRSALPLVLAITLHQHSLTAQGPAGVSEEAAVRSVVASYLHGLKFNDVDSLKAAFWPEARLFFTSRDGHLRQMTQSEWYAGFAKSAGQEEQGDLRIAAIEVTRDIASVKVVEDYPGSRYTDYLSLVRFDSQWKIVSKIYTGEKR